MGHIKKIWDYFFHHDFSEKMVGRIYQRLLSSREEAESEEALKGLWDGIGFPVANRSSDRMFNRMEVALGHRRRTRVPGWVRIAAIWLVPLLSLGLSYYWFQDTRIVKGTALVERFVPDGKREQVVLPDGSRVWLNSGTLLLFPSAFSDDKREVYLVGEGYFEVSERKEQPFVVRTRSMRVEVLGTEFNLSAYPDRDRIITTLEKGSVRIFPDDPALLPCVLKPDEQLEYAPSTGEMMVRPVMASYYSDWKEGGLLFNNDPFEEILRTLGRIYSVKVHLRTSAYHSNRLTIHFNKNESLETVLMLIKKMVPGLEYQIRKDEVYID